MTKIKERTYIVVTAEVAPLDARTGSRKHVSATTRIDRRKDYPVKGFFEKKENVKKTGKKSAKKGDK